MYINQNYKPFQYQTDTINKLTEICQFDGGCLICDSTGLGKSITATYTTKNLVSDTDRVLVVAPAATIPEWKNYMKSFGINAEVCTYAKPTAGNYAAVIVDEADHYKEYKTEYIKLFKIIRSSRNGGRMPYVLLLTATPIQNNIKQFKCMLSLIQFKKESVAYHILPQLFNKAETYSKDLDILLRYNDGTEGMAVTFKVHENRSNLKKSLEEIACVLPFFTVRNTREILVQKYPTDMEMIGHFPKIESVSHQTKYTDQTETNIIVLEKTIGQMKFPLYNKATYIEGGKFQAMTGIPQTTLLKRLDSSIHAFKQTLGRMLQTLKKELANPIESLEIDDIQKPINKEQYLVDIKSDIKDIEYLLDKWKGENDNIKLNQLYDIIKDGEKTIIFTEYIETYQLILEHLKSLGVGRLIGFSSDSPAKDLQTIKDNFDANAIQADDYDILVCTDALSAGVNLHQASRVVHYDERWNPNRITQRNGRVDRIMKYGSKDKVIIHTLYTNGIVESIIGLQKTIENKEWLASILLDFSNPMSLAPTAINFPENYEFGAAYSYEWVGGYCTYTLSKQKNATSVRYYKTNRGWLAATLNPNSLHCEFSTQQKTIYEDIVSKIQSSGFGLQNPVKQDYYKVNPLIENHKEFYHQIIGEKNFRGEQPILTGGLVAYSINDIYKNGIEAIESEFLKKLGYKSKQDTVEQFNISQSAKKQWIEKSKEYFLDSDVSSGKQSPRQARIKNAESPSLQYIDIAIGKPFECSESHRFPAKSFEYFEQFKGMEHPPQMESLFKYIPKTYTSNFFKYEITDFDVVNNKMKITYSEYKKVMDSIVTNAAGSYHYQYCKDITIFLSIVKQDFGMYEYSFECNGFKKNMLEHSLEFAIKNILEK